jgi:hypothetical protein
MSRDLYLNFSNNTTMTSLNTSDFSVKAHLFKSSAKVLVYGGNTTFYTYNSTGYDVNYGGVGNDNYIIWTTGLFDTWSATDTKPIAHYSDFNGVNYPITVAQGVGAIEITTSGMCTTQVWGEDTFTSPAQVAVVNGDGSFTSVASGYTGSGLNYTAYTHQDMSQVTSVDTQGYNMPPAVVIRCFNTNFDSHSGETVTATLYYTGVTYVSGGTGSTTTYIGQFPAVSFDRNTPNEWSNVDGSPSNPGNQHFTYIYDSLPDQTPKIGIHRGTWTFKLAVGASGTSWTNNKYVRAYLINNLNVNGE